MNKAQGHDVEEIVSPTFAADTAAKTPPPRARGCTEHGNDFHVFRGRPPRARGCTEEHGNGPRRYLGASTSALPWREGMAR